MTPGPHSCLPASLGFLPDLELLSSDSAGNRSSSPSYSPGAYTHIPTEWLGRTACTRPFREDKPHGLLLCLTQPQITDRLKAPRKSRLTGAGSLLGISEQCKADTIYPETH